MKARVRAKAIPPKIAPLQKENKVLPLTMQKTATIPAINAEERSLLERFFIQETDQS